MERIQSKEVSKDGQTELIYLVNEGGFVTITGDCKHCCAFPCKHIETRTIPWQIKEGVQ